MNNPTDALPLNTNNFNYWGTKGIAIVIEYSFLNTLPDYYEVGANKLDFSGTGWNTNNFLSLTPLQRNVTDAILSVNTSNDFRASYSDVILKEIML